MWFEFSFLYAIWISVNLLLSKKLLSGTSTISYIVVINFFSILFAIVLLFLRGGIPHVAPIFWEYALGATILDLFGSVAYYVALKTSPISLISPMASFNPIFTTIFAMIFLHELISPLKWAGILAIVVGAYLLNISEIKYGMLRPLKSLFSNRGVQFFLLANFLWGITPVLQKPALFATGRHEPLALSIVEVSLITLILFPFAKKQLKTTIKHFQQHWIIVVAIICIGTIAQIGAFSAFTLAPVGYATAIFKLSTLFSIFLGAAFFKEQHIKERFLGAAVMVFGTLLLAF